MLDRELTARLLDLVDVDCHDGAFSRDQREFARFRGPRALEVRLTKEHARNLKRDFRLENAYPPRDWVVAHFETEEDLDFAFRLAERAYRLLAKRPAKP